MVAYWINHPYALNILFTFIAVFLLTVSSQWTIHLLHKRILNAERFYYVKKTIHYLSFAIFVLIMFILWGGHSPSTTTYLGLLTAGLAIALKDLVVNIAAWAFILFRKPFYVGDRIEINGHAGDVIDQRIFQFTLMEIGQWVDGDQSTGRIIHIPNEKIFTEPLCNYAQGFKFIWNEIHVVLTFESDWEKAKVLLTKIAESHSVHLSSSAEKQVRESAKKFMIFYKNLTPIVYTRVIDHGVQLSIRYLCEPRKRRSTENAVWEDVLKAFRQEEDIQLAYNTFRVVKS